MSVEPARKILDALLVKRKEETGLGQRKKPRQQKKGAGQGSGKIDIKV